MYERCLTEADRVLASTKQVVLPVKELWNHVRTRCKAIGVETPTLADFTAMLDADTRFVVTSTQPEDDDLQPELFEDEGELAQLGIHAEDTVRLRRNPLPKVEDDDDEVPTTRVRGISTSEPKKSSTAKQKPRTKRKEKKGGATKPAPAKRKASVKKKLATVRKKRR